METTLIRGFVLILALAGFGSSSFTGSPASSSTHSNRPKANDGLPTCPISDPNHCGMTDDSN